MGDHAGSYNLGVLLPAAPVTPTASASAEAVVRAHADRDGFDADPVLAALGLITLPRRTRTGRVHGPARTLAQARRPQPWPTRGPRGLAPLTDDELDWMVAHGYARHAS